MVMESIQHVILFRDFLPQWQAGVRVLSSKLSLSVSEVLFVNGKLGCFTIWELCIAFAEGDMERRVLFEASFSLNR